MSIDFKVLVAGLRLVTWTGLALVLLFWVLIGVRVLMDRSNHIGFSMQPVVYLFVAVVALAGVYLVLSRSAMALVVVAFAAASIYGLTYLDRNNILVEYEVWLKRGMPKRGLPANR